MKMRGIEALDEANFLNASAAAEPVSTGALLVVLLEVLERADDFEELFLEPLEELLVRFLPDLEVLAIISRYLLFP